MKLPHPNKRLRVIGFDDAPFNHRRGSLVHVAGVICANTSFEGLVWGSVRRDGWNATDVFCRLLLGKKFLPQIHLVLLDGIAVGGFNIIDLPALHQRLQKPCIAVMRRKPHLEALEQAIRKLPRPDKRMELIRRAGPIHERPPFYFQVIGLDADIAAHALAQVTCQGHVPEALRLAHLIGAAIRTGESGRHA